MEGVSYQVWVTCVPRRGCAHLEGVCRQVIQHGAKAERLLGCLVLAPRSGRASARSIVGPYASTPGAISIYDKT
jgi:hypothetical protein